MSPPSSPTHIGIDPTLVRGGGPADHRAPAEVVSVESLRVRYDDTLAVDDVSLSIDRGEIFGILGPNGAGKTTTVECVGGLRRPDAGRIRVLGLEVLRHRKELRQHVGIQLQASELPDKLQVGEAIDLVASFYRDPRDPDELLDLLGLDGKRRTRFASLSGGQRQRLSIALAVLAGYALALGALAVRFFRWDR